ncbi:hypothetical protein GWK47_033903 [Chionoecetes opilio]|uniref:Uncharacterized protein n=1 Tax=Chionoecetes opilio TaxID=41210 RepID=A0A8J5D3T8_CHIOP|nr:hypothetical protein GWK47_033903 [Chionoecetes opilio]
MFDIAHSKQWKRRYPRKTRRSGGSEGGPAELLDGWRGREAERATEKKRRKRQRMEEMKKKDAAGLRHPLLIVTWLWSILLYSHRPTKKTEDDDFKAPTPAKCPRRRTPKENSSPRS